MKNKETFVHLHVHTEYSILDGVGRLEEMVEKAAKNNSKALSITDHGSVSGHIDFQLACSKRDIKPIFGCEFYTCKNYLDKNEKHRNHLVLLAKNEIGYKNLIKLASIAAVDGFYYKPRIDFELLEKYHEGLICLSACIGGEIPQAIIKENFGEAFETAKKFKELFEEDFYLELQPNRIPEQQLVNAALVDLTRKLDIELVVTNDAHYPDKDDWMTHEIILCIKTHAKMSDKNRFKFDDNTFYLMTEEEICEAFKKNHIVPQEIIEKAIKNTSIIAEKCNHTINKKMVVLPTFKFPNEFLEANEYLEFLAQQGLKKDYVIKKIKQYSKLNKISFEESQKIYSDRVKTELETIFDLNFSKYILIVWEIYQFCKKKEISCGPGRGSVAGSSVAYILGITTVDPIENGLYFNRFLTPKRIDYPDIDMDFEDSRRGEVVQHLKDLYGEDKVANISTFGRMKGKSVLKDVSRVFGVPYHDVNKITGLISNDIGEETFSTIKTAIENSKEMKYFARTYPDAVKFAQKLEGQIKIKGIHAAGIVVSEKPIEDICPVEKREDKLITSFDGHAAENIGLLKLDVLGLRTMTIIRDALKNIEKSTGERIKLEEVPLDDKGVFKLLNDGMTAGIFQLETQNMTKLCRKVKVNSFEDIVHVNALGRPGTMRSGATARYIAIKHKKASPKYIHSAMKPITEDTHSIILFQEQIMRVLADIGNFNWEEVDIQRKIISKSKGSEAFEKAREKFIKGARENGIEEEVGNKLYSQMVQSGNYSFNLSHSAAYSTISFWCAWLKQNYPSEFFAAALSQTEEKEQEYIKEARKLGLQISSPNINESGFNFISKDNKILGSLKGVKGLGDKGIQAIVENRPYKDFQEFLNKMPKGKVNRKSIEVLIKIGAFGEKGAKTTYDNFIIGKSIYQKTLFDFNEEETKTREWTEKEVEQFQNELYILPPLIHPIEKHKELIDKMEIASDFNLISEIDFEEQKGETIWIRGVITRVIPQHWGEKLVERPTPNSSTYNYYSKHPWDSKHCLFDLEDETNLTLCSVFPDIFEKYGKILEVGTPILIKGKVGFNIDRIYIQDVYDLNELDSCVKSGKLSKAQKVLFNNPLRKYEHLKHTSLCDLEESGTAIGIFGNPKLHVDKNENEMAFIPFEDMTGSITIICFASDWTYKKHTIKEGLVAGINLKRMQGNGKSYSANKIVLLNLEKV